MSVEFRAFPKIPRLNKPVVITEKIDGTNGCIVIQSITTSKFDYVADGWVIVRAPNGGLAAVKAQSRSRFVTPDADNHGFAAWVYTHADTIVADLGDGHHYGEWWGSGINRGYELDHKRFSLFNTSRWDGQHFQTSGMGVVPVIATLNVFDTPQITEAVNTLRKAGSLAVPGFMRPEGVVVYHTAANQMFKVLVENDDIPKSLTQADVELAA